MTTWRPHLGITHTIIPATLIPDMITGCIHQVPIMLTMLILRNSAAEQAGGQQASRHNGERQSRNADDRMERWKRGWTRKKANGNAERLP